MLDPDQMNADPQPLFQVCVLDPSRVTGICRRGQLEIDDSCLQSGLTVKPGVTLDMKAETWGHLNHVDFWGFVILNYDSVFIAAIC
jgi:hypothetical protein